MTAVRPPFAAVLLALTFALSPAAAAETVKPLDDPPGDRVIEGDAQIDSLDGLGTRPQSNTSTLGVGAGSENAATPEPGSEARSVLIFELPEADGEAAKATLTLTLNRTFGNPEGPVSVYAETEVEHHRIIGPDFQSDAFKKVGELEIEPKRGGKATVVLTDAVNAVYEAGGPRTLLKLRLQMDEPQGFYRFLSADNKPEPTLEIDYEE